ncbi:hypothetical protein DE146DRAFT_670279 [Phaeosphaeria sp. MPI-PUGE-AT-0046c]|nr:hypothetical protein DE146DRAFT_670279 [Phaeosphaeria sp. MPI-PUGE-AT-0046c]
MERSVPAVNTGLAAQDTPGSSSHRDRAAQANDTDGVHNDAILHHHTTTKSKQTLTEADSVPTTSDAIMPVATKPRYSASSNIPRSLLDLQRWPIVTAGFEDLKAAQMSLPASTTSSLVTAESDSKVSSPVETHPEESKAGPQYGRVHEEQKSRWGAIRSLMEAKARLKKINQQKKERGIPVPRHISEPQIYHENVSRLAEAHPNLKVVATAAVRHQWNSRILYYDYTNQAEHVTKHEPWSEFTDAPDFSDFHKTLRTIPENCLQRVILVEDLNPALINLLGVTFDIPPQVFEEHLKQSGYTSLESDKDVGWHMASSDQGYMSISWYRPVLPIIPVTPLLRKKLTSGDQPQIRRNRRNVHLHTTTNIWRPTLGLCPAPGVYHKGSKPEYPVGWEEKVTIWVREIEACRVVVILMDPLPVLTEGARINNITITKDQQKDRFLRAVHPTARLKQQTLEKNIRMPHDPTAPQASQNRKGQEWAAQASHSARDSSSSQRKSGSHEDLDQSVAAVEETQQIKADPPSLLRRRLDRAHTEQRDIEGHQNSAKIVGLPEGKLSTSTTSRVSRQKSHEEAVDLQSQLSSQGLVWAHTQSFIPYQSVKVRFSSALKAGNTFSAFHMQEHIEGLQAPTSTLEEYEHFLGLPSKGKSTVHDPLQALFRVIHDDTAGLVDIVRVSLRQVREGTLDEDLMQKRVTFWRSLLHRLNFSLADLEQRLGAFAELAFDSESLYYEDDPHRETPSKKLVRSTRHTLQKCIELIERCSSSLLAEMQIVDSRRSIAEAESISKLTELAFVFVPLSFVASLFSMQVRELEQTVPAYTFVLVALAFVFVAYAFRLGIRSSRLVDYQNRILNQMREESDLQYNQSIPTRIFLVWMSKAMGTKTWSFLKRITIVVMPMVFMAALFAALISPIVLLWLRDINKGFSAAITVLVLSLDVILFHPILMGEDNSGFNPKEIIREMRREREAGKRRAKARGIHRADLDPEALSFDGDQEGYEWGRVYTRSTVRTSVSARSRK